MNILKDVGAVLKFYDHPVIGPISLGTCTILQLLVESIYPHGDRFPVIMSQDGSLCIHINTFRVDRTICINGF